MLAPSAGLCLIKTQLRVSPPASCYVPRFNEIFVVWRRNTLDCVNLKYLLINMKQEQLASNT